MNLLKNWLLINLSDLIAFQTNSSRSQGWWDLKRRENMKKWASKEGPAKKIWSVRGGSPKIITIECCNGSICKSAKNLTECLE